MDVFILSPDPDRYESFLIIDDEDDDRLRDQFGCPPIGNSWSPVEIEPLNENPEDNDLPASDFPSLGGPIDVFSARAVDELADLLDGRGELLPLAYEGGDYYAFNVTQLSDALDEEGSELDRFDDGRVMGIDCYAFRSERLVGETIFKLRQTPRSITYVTDTFVDRVNETGLTGFLLDQKVWSDPRLASLSSR